MFWNMPDLDMALIRYATEVENVRCMRRMLLISIFSDCVMVELSCNSLPIRSVRSTQAERRIRGVET